MRSGRLRLMIWAAGLWLSAGGGAEAGLFHHEPKPKAAATVDDATVNAVQQALDESRLSDAGRLLDRAVLAGEKDPRLTLLAGELDLAREHFQDALAELKQAEANSDTRAKALEGEGIALSMLGRSDDALAVLQKAVTDDPTAWRAWNALAGEYDLRRDWNNAEAAYDHANANSDGAAIVLNNRGYSRLLQGRFAAAREDFVAALQKKPDLAAARTNLRLAMAMQGEYDRATAGSAQDDQATLLNNAGFAAMMRGDYAMAETLFNKAIEAKGTYYARASQNLAMAKALAAQQKAGPSAAQ